MKIMGMIAITAFLLGTAMIESTWLAAVPVLAGAAGIYFAGMRMEI
jgi:hypothetical protein